MPAQKHPTSRWLMYYIYCMDETPPKNRGGRPKLPDADKGKNRSLRLTDARWIKLKRLGVAWLNRAIDRAKEEPEQQ